MILAIASLGWRDSFKAMGYAGLVVGALITFLVKDPKAEEKKKSDKPLFEENLISYFKNSIQRLLSNETCRWNTIGASLSYFAAYSVTYFMPAFFQTVYPAYRPVFSKANALAVGILGFVSILAGGAISDKLKDKNP